MRKTHGSLACSLWSPAAAPRLVFRPCGTKALCYRGGQSVSSTPTRARRCASRIAAWPISPSLWPSPLCRLRRHSAIITSRRIFIVLVEPFVLTLFNPYNLPLAFLFMVSATFSGQGRRRLPFAILDPPRHPAGLERSAGKQFSSLLERR